MRSGIDLHSLYGRVRVVDIAEDLRVRRVALGASRPGQWEMVDIAEKFSVEFVEIGEDFRVKFVDIAEGVA